MQNIIFGSIIILFTSVGYYFSWKKFNAHKFNAAVLLLMICGFALCLFSASDFFLHPWDERYHALVAKNLIEHPFTPTLYDNPVLPYDYTNWPGNHVWVHKQPVPLWSMAASMFLFGVNVIALRLPSILLTTLGTYLIYSIGANLFTKKTGFIAAFLFSINGLIIELTAGRAATDHIDVFFMIFILAAIYFIVKYTATQKKYYTIFIGILIGLAILTKWLVALIVFPVWFILVVNIENVNFKQIAVQLVVLIIVTTCVALPWQLYIHREFPKEAAWEALYNIRHYNEALDGQDGGYFYFLNKIRINYGELIYLPIGWFLWRYRNFLNNKKQLALIIWLVIPLLIFSFAKTKMQGYILFTAPALFIMTADFYSFIQEKIKSKTRYKIVFQLILVLLIALPIRYSIERIKPFEHKERCPTWVNDLQTLDLASYENPVLFNYDHPIEAMFYTDLTAAYAHIPDSKTITDLISRNIVVIINVNRMDSTIQLPQNVVYVKLSSANKD